MDRRLFLLSALALSGCATAPPPAQPPPRPAPPPQAPPAPIAGGSRVLAELESLYRADAGRDAITISVASNGCTSKGDFTFHAERHEGSVTLAFARRRIDTCKSFAMGKTDLTFTWAELGVLPRSPVFLLNPVTAWTGPGS